MTLKYEKAMAYIIEAERIAAADGIDAKMVLALALAHMNERMPSFREVDLRVYQLPPQGHA